MRVEVETGESRVVVTIHGSLDLYSASILKKELSGLLERGETDLVFEMSDVDFIDSSGLGVLVGTFKQVRVERGNVVLVGLRPVVRRIFSITRLDKIFEIFDTLEAARHAA